MKFKMKKGFTVVELVIVIAVIAILSAVLIPTFANLISKADESALQQNLTNAYTEYVIDTNGGNIVAKDKVVIYKESTITNSTKVYMFNTTDKVWKEVTVTAANYEVVTEVVDETPTAKAYNNYYVFLPAVA